VAQTSQLVREIRNREKLSQAALAKAIGVSAASVSNYESGKAKPGKKTADKILELYGVDILAKDEKKAPAGNASVKNAPSGKSAAKKAKVKKGATKKAGETAVSTKVEPDIVKREEPSELKVSIQSLMGGSILVDDIVARVHASAPDAKEIYVKPEENRAYYVGKTSEGFVVLWE